MNNLHLLDDFKKLKKINFSSYTNILGKVSYNSFPLKFKNVVDKQSFHNSLDSMNNFPFASFFWTTFSDKLMFHCIHNVLKKYSFKYIIDHFYKFKETFEMVDSKWCFNLLKTHFFLTFNYILENNNQISNYILSSISLSKKDFVLDNIQEYLLCFEKKDPHIEEKIATILNQHGILVNDTTIADVRKSRILFFYRNLFNYLKSENINTPEYVWLEQFISGKKIEECFSINNIINI